MTAKTPGQRACIAWNGHYAEQHGIEARNEWAASDPRGRGAWEAAAQAVLNDAFPGLRAQLDQANAKLAAVLKITEGIALSAQVTGPSKKSQIEAKIAGELLAALQGTEA